MRGKIALAFAAALAMAGTASAQDVVMRRPLAASTGQATPSLPFSVQTRSVRAAGTTVVTAAMKYLAATGRLPGGPSDLVPAYLSAMPTSDSASIQGWAFYSVGSRGLFQMSVPSEDVCKAINRDANNGFGDTVIPGGSERGVNEGCYAHSSLGFIYVDWYNN